MKQIPIGGRYVGDGCPVYIISEVGINHNGDLNLAREMIDAAAECGVDAVKFQLFKTDEIIQDRTEEYEYLSQGRTVRESQYDMFKRYELSREDMAGLADYCRKREVVFFATPQNLSDLKELLEIGVPVVKVGSDDLSHVEMLKEYASHGLPLILSSGMAYLYEIDEALQGLMAVNRDIILLHCVSLYPTPFADANMLKIRSLIQIYPDLVIGFSDHTIGTTAAVMAVTLGARVYERHFTMDKGLPGPDHRFSADPKELKEVVQGIREAEEALGSPELRPAPGEEEMRSIARRSIVADRPIEKDEILSPENLACRRPGRGVPPRYMAFVLNRRTRKALEKGEVIRLEDIY